MGLRGLFFLIGCLRGLVMRRSSYEVMAAVQRELLRDPRQSVYALSKRVGVKWVTVRSILGALEGARLFKRKS